MYFYTIVGSMILPSKALVLLLYTLLMYLYLKLNRDLTPVYGKSLIYLYIVSL